MTAFNAYSIRKRDAKVIINFEKTTTSCEKHSDFNRKRLNTKEFFSQKNINLLLNQEISYKNARSLEKISIFAQ